MARDKIKRSFVWMRKALELIDRTTLPGEILGEVRPTLDTFGWEVLSQRTEVSSATTGAPSVITNGPITPEGVLRLYLHASCRHTDAAVSHFIWIEKFVTSIAIGLVASPQFVPLGVPIGLDRWVVVEPGARLRARLEVAAILGSLAIDLNFIDLPIGEYIPAI